MGLFLLSGAAVIPARAEAPAAPLPPTLAVRLTGYNAVPEQTDEDPLMTASGAYANAEVVAARSRDLAGTLPFGTVIEFEDPKAQGEGCGYALVAPLVGYRVIADVMNERFTDRVDVLFATDANVTRADGRSVNASRVLGFCPDVEIRVVGRIDLSRAKNLPRTQAELARIVEGANRTVAVK